MADLRELLPAGGHRRPPRVARPGGAFDHPVAEAGAADNLTMLCDPALGAPGLALARRLSAAMEAPYRALEACFGLAGGPVTVILAPLGGRHDGSGGACHPDGGFDSGAVLHVDATFAARHVDPLALATALAVSQLAECFMVAQGRGWVPGFSHGEGLSRFLASELAAPGSFAAYATGPAWAAAGYPDWLSATERTDSEPVSVGCAVVYLNWLRALGYTLSQIVQAGGATLAANYRSLTGRSTAYRDLRAALARLAVTGDDPFGPPVQQPALAVLGERLHLAWKRRPTDAGIYWSTGDGTGWAARRRLDLTGTGGGPALAALRDRLVMAWKAPDDDPQILCSLFDGTAWAPERPVPGAETAIGPKLAVLNGRLHMIWKGAGTDTAIYWASLQGAGWSAPRMLAHGATAFGPALASLGSRLHAVWRAAPGDERLWWSSFDGATWGVPLEMPGIASSVGPALAAYKGALYAVGKGGAGEPGLWWSRLSGLSWSDPQALADGTSSVGPGLAAFGDALVAIWQGEVGDDRLFCSRFDGTRWTPQQAILGLGEAAATGETVPAAAR